MHVKAILLKQHDYAAFESCSWNQEKCVIFILLSKVKDLDRKKETAIKSDFLVIVNEVML